MLTRSSLFFPLVLALLLAIITFWINLTVEQQGPKIDGSDRHDPDYTMNHFVNTQTDTTGKLRYVLAAAEMVHYPDDDSTVLQRPRFTQYTTDTHAIDKPYTRIEGLRGYVSSNGEQVTLVDNVKVTRQAFDGKGEMQIATEKLDILPNQDIAKTDAPVVITQAPKTVIHATGMIFDKKHQTMQLLKRVKVHYERPTGVATNKAKPAAKQTSSKPASKPASKQVSEPIAGASALVSEHTLASNNKHNTTSKRQTITVKSRSNK